MPHRRRVSQSFPPEQWTQWFGSTGSTRSRSASDEGRFTWRGRSPKNFQRTDARLLEVVCEALRDHPYIDASDISVSVHQGQVTLEGTIEDRLSKYLAEEEVDRIAGVKEVHNKLKVR